MPEKRYKKLRTAGELQKLVERHYLKARYLRLGKPLVWVTSGAPVELLRAMDVVPVYPENYGAICGARGAAAGLCEVAEGRGYSRDLCSYAKSHLGSMFDARQAPLGGLPRPDLLVACNNICGTVLKWYEAAAEFYRVPLFVLDTPFVHDELYEHAVDYVQAQFGDLAAFVAKHTRRKLREDRLWRAANLANECTQLWAEIRELCRARPSPLNAPDLFVNMAPIVVLRGTIEAVDFYKALKAEVEERVAHGVGAVPEERHRLLWDNIAIWHRLYRLYRSFVDRGACFVVDTYTNAWSGVIAGSDLFDGLARTYTAVLLNQSLQARAEQMIELIERFEVDGFVMHSNRSCKPYSFGQYDIKRLVSERTGVPGLIIEADHCDPRVYADEPIQARIQAFMETLA
jgi:benzoyl-CoA reductase/2-hydroxyglutaryl-CoA dehydratase subunit BcrC/BadD/HgdB